MHRLLGSLLLAALLAPGTARAKDVTHPNPRKDTPPLPREPAQTQQPTDITPKDTGGMTPSALAPSLDHRRQFGFDLGLGTGFRIIKPYTDIWCGSRSDDPDNPNDPFCLGMVPLYLDLGLSFGVTKTIDLLAHFRYGLLADSVSERHPIALLAGFRAWIGPSRPFKWSVGFDLFFDFTKQDGPKQELPTYGKPEHDEFDVGGRLVFRFQYDFMRYLGIYAEAAGLAGVLRWLRLELEGTFGIQARLP